MSFILDALKKSERARQRQAGPSLFEVKIAAPRRTLPAWVVIIGILLVINAAVVGWMMLRHPARRVAPAASASAAAPPDSSPQAHPVGAPLAARSPPYDAPGVPHAAANASGLRTMSTAAASSASQGHTAHTPAGSPPAQPPSAASGAAASDYAPAVEPSTGTQAVDANLPLYREVDSAPGKSLPSLHLDLHVYDADPGKRFVMINMHKLKQGDSLPDGVKVVSIRPDGVVLSYEGRQFLLPR